MMTDIRTDRMPQPPQFDNIDAERLHRKQRLAAALRVFAKLGFDEGIAGHITARDPEKLDHFWVNPLGMHFGLIKVSDLILVNHHGDVVIGDTPVNQAAFAIHSQIHNTRPDVVAAAHAHSIYGKSWSSLGKLLDPLTQDACSFYQDCALFSDYSGVVIDPREGEKIVNTLGNNKAIILQNHGLLTVGHSVDEAAWWFISMERSCQAQLLAQAAGNPISLAEPLPWRIDPKTAALAHQQVGSHAIGWFNFQSLYETIVYQQPELLD